MGAYLDWYNTAANCYIGGWLIGARDGQQLGDSTNGYASVWVRVKGQPYVTSGATTGSGTIHDGWVEIHGGTYLGGVFGGGFSGSNLGSSHVLLDATDYNITVGSNSSSSVMLVSGGCRDGGYTTEGDTWAELKATNGKTITLQGCKLVGNNNGSGGTTTGNSHVSILADGGTVNQYTAGTTYGGSGSSSAINGNTYLDVRAVNGGKVALYGETAGGCQSGNVGGDSYARFNAVDANTSIITTSGALLGACSGSGNVAGKAFTEMLGHGIVGNTNTYGSTLSGSVGAKYSGATYVSWVVIDNDNPSSYTSNI